MFEKEKIYIAGPECFYKNGFSSLNAMRRYSESLGFGVTLPNDDPLDMENVDLQKRADSIFCNLKKVMKETTVIIADLEAYRGSESDSGTIFEIGMAYADGLKCYGYTRDKRPMAWKDQNYVMRDGVVYDDRNQTAPYKELPFSPTIIGSTKIVEGDYYDCLAMLINDMEEEWKAEGKNPKKKVEVAEDRSSDKTQKRPKVYLSDIVRYGVDAEQKYAKMKEICENHGLIAVTPLDQAPQIEKTTSENPYTKAANLTENYLQLIKSCDGVIADLNDYRGFECANDVGFECGIGLELNKKLYGYMDDTRPTIQKIPHLGENAGFRDMTGSNVENFNYPINLMFACSMEIFEGKFEDIISQVAENLK